ncbi:MAG: LPS export ABC transporter permease LptG [Deltaproteobacteria bacterium]|nr:MAG: LPS export ABC transporter permease LptG [Deltaproteobacteria bacterium]
MEKRIANSVQIIQKYLAKEILRTFAIVLATAMSIYLVIDFFEKIDDFLEAGVPISQALVFFMFRLPFIIVQVTPVGVLLAVLLVLGLMVRNNELVALQSGGIGIRYLLKPLLLLSLAFSFVLFFFSEIMVPITMAKANNIWRVKVNKQVATFKQKDIWIKGNRAIYHIAYFNPVDKSISGVTFNFFDDKFNMTKRIDAKKGIHESDHWLLQDCVEQIRLQDGSYQVSYPLQRILKIDLMPEDLKKIAKKSEEMSSKELSTYIQKVKDEGYDATPYQVDWQAKLAFPSICLVMTIVGTAIALRNKKGEGIAMGVAYGIAVAFCYWVVYGFCLSMGYNGFLRPFLAAWLTNIVFVVLGTLLLLYVD